MPKTGNPTRRINGLRLRPAPHSPATKGASRGGAHPAGFDKKLQHILRHAAQVFAEKGYEGASIRDISRATGVSLSGLYYYFRNKQELLYLIQSNAFTSILERLESRLRATADPVERCGLLVRNHLEYFLSHPVEMKVLSHEAEALEAPYSREVADLKRRYYALAMGIFEEMQKCGAAAAGQNPRVAVLLLFGMMNWIYTWYNPRVDPKAEELAGAVTGIFLRGVQGGGVAPEARAELAHAI